MGVGRIEMRPGRPIVDAQGITMSHPHLSPRSSLRPQALDLRTASGPSPGEAGIST